jgi:hypothetical protein
MPNQTTRRNHYNPKSYLSGFTTKKHIYRYDHKEGVSHLIYSLDNIGVERDIYSQTFEDFLGDNIDANFPKVRNAIIKSARTLEAIPPEDISLIISFILFQYLRHPSSRDFHIQEISRYRSSLAYGQDPALQEFLDDLYSPQESYESVSYIVYTETFNSLTNKNWTILKAPCRKTFITNDKSTGMISSEIEPEQEGLGFGTKNTLLFFPIDKKFCLLLEDGENGLNRGIATIECEEKLFNLIQGTLLLCAKKYIYTSNPYNIKLSLREADKIKSYTEEVLNTNLDDSR